MSHIFFLILAFATMTAMARDAVESVAPDPMGGGTPVATNSPATTPTKEEPVADPMGGATTPTSNATTNQAVEAVAEPPTPSDPMGGAGKEPESTPSAEKKNTHPTQTSAHPGNRESKFTLRCRSPERGPGQSSFSPRRYLSANSPNPDRFTDNAGSQSISG